MSEIIKMIVVLTAISAAAALLLAGVNQGTQEQIKAQIRENEIGPALEEIFAWSTNNPLDDYKEMNLSALPEPIDVFPAFKDGELKALAFETQGKGFGGEIGVVLGIDVSEDTLAGIGITSHSETPGLGARIAEPGFIANFQGLSMDGVVKVRADGGGVDAISGATISSRAVCTAISSGLELFNENRAEIEGLFQGE